MDTKQKTAARLLEEVLEVGNIDQVIAFGKDGFVIESIGSGRTTVDIEKLGATLAAAVNEMDKLSRMTNCGELDNITVAFQKACILAMATSNAVICVIASDNSSLGFLRIKMNSLKPQLEPLL